MTAIDIIFFVLLIGLFGLVSHFLFFQDSSQEESGMLEWFTFRLLSGVATLSVLLLVAAFTGLFFKTVIFSSLAILLFFFAFKWFRQTSITSFRLLHYLIFCFGIGLSSLTVASFTRPYQAIISSHDATIYIACAFQLADSGSIQYKDPLVLEMDSQEREAIFARRIGYVRFEGGVPLRNLEKGIVGFGFLPLFSVWLAFAILFLGTHQFLSLLSVFTVLGVLLLYLIGKKLSGPLLGILFPLVLFFFLPQFYFSRLPLTECCAQALFLSGLFVFTGRSSVAHQRLSGVLWGSLLLCRIEILFLLPISLMLLFTLHPEYRAKWHHWRVFILIVTAFAMLLFCLLLFTGTYTSIWGLTNRPIMRFLWLPAVTFLRGLIRTQGGSLAFAFLFLSAVILAGFHYLLKKQFDSRNEKWISIAGVVLAAVVVLSLTGLQFNWKRVLNTALNVLIYIPKFFVVALLAGYIFLLFKKVRQPNDHLILTLMLFFLPPALFFVSRPLIGPYQPLFVRRFVVAAFPLFFLLSLTAWLQLLLIIIRPAAVAKSIFVVLALLLASFFYADSAFLIGRPLFADVIPQVEKVAAQLPPNALVLIPLREAGVHMELPLQYMTKRDTVTIPGNPAHAALFDSFLRRQIERHRAIFILSERPPDKISTLLPNFIVEHKFSEKVVFRTLPGGKVDRLPTRSKKILRFHGYRILPGPTESEKWKVKSDQ